jgi:hypothetical protein
MEELTIILQDLELGKISVDDAKQQVLDLFADPPFWLDGNNAYLIGEIYKKSKTEDDGYKFKAVQLLRKRANEFGYNIHIINAIQIIEAYCC